MKRWSIKKKIIFWYTLFFALLIAFDFYFLSTASSQVLIEQASNTLKDASIEVADSLQVEDDGIYEEDDDDEEKFSFYHDGVIFLVYKDNQVVFGNVPDNFDQSVSISLNQIQEETYNGMDWLVYDIEIEKGHVLRGMYDLNPVVNSIQQVIMIAGILSPIIVLIASIGGYIIIKRSFRPIRDIYTTASIIKEEEDYTKRIETSLAKDEIYELADMVNQMLDRVEQSMNREKQFSSNVSHELRTPLTVMQAQAEYMLEKTDDSAQKADIKTIIQQILFMENIVTQLLEITRTRQIADTDMDIVNLYELIKFTADSFLTNLEEKSILLKIVKPDYETNIFCNQTMVIRVFSNLIINAIKYNNVGGKIDIQFNVDNGFLITSVKDTGIGIPKTQLGKIFDTFYRTDESRTQNEYSLGLGLALAREVVKIHNGDIQVDSQENIGTTFKVLLPLSDK